MAKLPQLLEAPVNADQRRGGRLGGGEGHRPPVPRERLVVGPAAHDVKDGHTRGPRRAEEPGKDDTPDLVCAAEILHGPVPAGERLRRAGVPRVHHDHGRVLPGNVDLRGSPASEPFAGHLPGDVRVELLVVARFQPHGNEYTIRALPKACSPQRRCSMGMELIRVSPEGDGFTGDKGRAFVPWGCNYYDPFTGWAPHLWQQFDPVRVGEHFSQMRGIGVNVVRVFSTLACVLESADKTSAAGLTKIGQMLEIAAAHGIRVILSGPGTWEGTPSWWHAADPLECFVKPGLLSAQAAAWKGIAAALRGNPGLFSYELYNEPCVPWKPSPSLRESWAAWRTGRTPMPPDDLPTPTPPLFLDWSWDLQRFRDTCAVEYVRRMTEAIRAQDTGHLVTVGLHQKSAPFDWYPPLPPTSPVISPSTASPKRSPCRSS